MPKTARLLTFCMLSVCSLLSVEGRPLRAEGSASQAPRPPLADPSEFRWDKEQASLLFSLNQYDGDCEIQLIRRPHKPQWFDIRFQRNGKPLLVFTGHTRTVFVAVGPVVYYADYNFTTAGCALVAYDLNKRKELWRTWLKAALGPPHGHSHYSNAVTLGVAYDQEPVLLVFGRESYGDYMESVNMKTGKTTQHKLFRQGFQ